MNKIFSIITAMTTALLFTATLLQPADASPPPSPSPDGARFKAALNDALGQPERKKTPAAVRAALSALDSTEAALAAFEILFLARYRDESLKSFSEFEKFVEAEIDAARKNEYLQIAALYSAFVNHALGSPALTFRPTAVRPGETIPLIAALCEKYRALFETAKNDAKLRGTSADFISYLEKKCALSSTNDLTAAENRVEELAIRAFSATNERGDRRAAELVRRRYLFALMVYKAVSKSGDERAKKLAATVIKELFPERLFNIYFPDGVFK